MHVYGPLQNKNLDSIFDSELTFTGPQFSPKTVLCLRRPPWLSILDVVDLEGFKPARISKERINA
jgi:hypothetical protein